MNSQQKEVGTDAVHEGTLHEKPSEDDVNDLKKINTVDALHVDLENSGAIKGDDSDGRINWTLKQVLATIFLAGLYVGKMMSISEYFSRYQLESPNESLSPQAPNSRCSSLEELCSSLQRMLEERKLRHGCQYRTHSSLLLSHPSAATFKTFSDVGISHWAEV